MAGAARGGGLAAGGGTRRRWRRARGGRRRVGRAHGAEHAARRCVCRRGRPVPPRRSSSPAMAALAGRSVPAEAPLWPSLEFESAALPVGRGGAPGSRRRFVDRRRALPAAHPRSCHRGLDAALVARGRGRRRADRGHRRREGGRGRAARSPRRRGRAASRRRRLLRAALRCADGARLPRRRLHWSMRRKAPRSTAPPPAGSSFAIVAAVSVVVGVAATRYIDRPLPPPRFHAGRRRRYSPESRRRSEAAACRRSGDTPPLCGSPAPALLDRDPVRNDVVVGAVHCGDVAARRPRDHLPVQRDVVGLRVVREQRLVDLAQALARHSCRS